MQRAVSTQERAAALFPTVANRFELMSAYGSLGDLAGGEDAVKAYDRSLAACESGLALEPGNVRGLRGRAVALYKLGDAGFKLGRFESALARSQQALAAMSRLDMAPVSMQRLEAATLQGVGEAERELGRWRQGLPALDKALAIHERMAKADPANQQHTISRAIILKAKGDNLRAGGESSAAGDAYRRCRLLLEQVVAKDPNTMVWRDRLAEVRLIESRR